MESLIGSSTLPAVIELTPEIRIQLGELVAYAHGESDMSAKDWNALKDAKRDEMLDDALEDLKELAAEGKLPESVKPLPPEAPKGAGAKKARGEELDKDHFMHPHYNGPLTGEQAAVRNQHLTPHRIAGTGPYAKIK